MIVKLRKPNLNSSLQLKKKLGFDLNFNGIEVDKVVESILYLLDFNFDIMFVYRKAFEKPIYHYTCPGFKISIYAKEDESGCKSYRKMFFEFVSNLHEHDCYEIELENNRISMTQLLELKRIYDKRNRNNSSLSSL